MGQEKGDATTAGCKEEVVDHRSLVGICFPVNLLLLKRVWFLKVFKKFEKLQFAKPYNFDNVLPEVRKEWLFLPGHDVLARHLCDPDLRKIEGPGSKVGRGLWILAVSWIRTEERLRTVNQWHNPNKKFQVPSKTLMLLVSCLCFWSFFLNNIGSPPKQKTQRCESKVFEKLLPNAWFVVVGYRTGYWGSPCIHFSRWWPWRHGRIWLDILEIYHQEMNRLFFSSGDFPGNMWLAGQLYNLVFFRKGGTPYHMIVMAVDTSTRYFSKTCMYVLCVLGNDVTHLEWWYQLPHFTLANRQPLNREPLQEPRSSLCFTSFVLVTWMNTERLTGSMLKPQFLKFVE